jgi:hypothetical protein
MRYYEEIIATDTSFKELRLPREFFVAVNRLQYLGAPSKEIASVPPLFDLKFSFVVRRDHVDAALLIGYYLASDSEARRECGKNPEDGNLKFLASLLRSGNSPELGPASYRIMYCNRIEAITQKLRSLEGGSERAELVLGVQDGVIRWFFSNVRPSLQTSNAGDVCLEAGNEGLRNVVESSAVQEIVRKVLTRIGMQRDFPICLWNPGKYKHDISTLILKGKADPIIASCQAEEVFKNGLTGNRVLVEFPGVGHSMVLPLVQDGDHDEQTIAFRGPDNTTIVAEFLEAADTGEFINRITEGTSRNFAVLKSLRADLWRIEGEFISRWSAVAASPNTCFDQS